MLEKFGVGPEKLIDAQALIGDSVDNVPGVPGIGPKTAAQLLTEFGDLEGVLAAAPAMKPSKRRDLLIEHAEKARMSRVLVTLRDDAPLPLPLEALHPRAAEPAKLIAWLTAQGFRSIISRLGLEDAPASPAAPGSTGAPSPVTSVSAGGKQAQLDLGGAPAPAPPIVSGDFGPYEMRHYRRGVAQLGGRGVRARRGRDWIPRPMGWTRCARSWSACRWRPRAAAPATCRCVTPCWRNRSRWRTRSRCCRRC